MLKTRKFPDKNYNAIFLQGTGKTIRFTNERLKPIGSLDFPELLDISFGTRCYADCEYCYADSKVVGVVYPDLVDKINKYFGNMTPNERPFQVAIGGGGEPTLHPEFIEAVKAFHALGIMPNYTTNCMHLTNDILDATEEFCGGVAVSCHTHLRPYWEHAIKEFTDRGIRTNIHVIVGEAGSVDYFWELYRNYKDCVDYFVILPYSSAGRGNSSIQPEQEWDTLFHTLKGNEYPNIAFGALFYDYFREHPEKVHHLNLDLYEPEIMSGYVMMNTDDLIIRKSSFDLRVK